jgi:tyrosyl-tRNA synthetase
MLNLKNVIYHKNHLLKKYFTTQANNDNIFSHLNERKLISNISHNELTNPESKLEILGNNPRLYIGFDPTAHSLHLGNLIGILTSLRFSAYGIEPVLVIGGATGQIGDPSGKSKERPILEKEKINKNIEGIKDNLKSVFENVKYFDDFKTFYKNREENRKVFNKADFSFTKDLPKNSKLKYDLETLIEELKNYPDMLLKNHSMKKSESASQKIDFNYLIVNNEDFYKDISVIDFLREVGTNLRMGPLLSRESIKNRVNSKDGLSLTEFMYQTFQGYDFLKLYERYNVKIQIGGSDQWGNMLAGYELIKKTKNTEVVNMTFPLLTTANGQKFGKSEGNALFLDQKLTSPNDIYQYFIKIQDEDIHKLLSVFTFLDTYEIDDIAAYHKQKPETRTGQKMLAEKMVSLLYSDEVANKTKKSSQIHYVNDNNLDAVYEMIEAVELVEDAFANNMTISKLCNDYKLVKNRTEAKRLIESGSILVNNNKIKSDDILTKGMLMNGQYLIIKVGKTKAKAFKYSQTSSSDEKEQPTRVTLNQRSLA